MIHQQQSQVGLNFRDARKSEFTRIVSLARYLWFNAEGTAFVVTETCRVREISKKCWLVSRGDHKQPRGMVGASVLDQ